MSQRTMPKFILPLAILLEFATLGPTLWGGGWLLRERTADEDNIRIEHLRKRTFCAIDVRLESDEAALWGGSELWNAQPHMRRSAWQAYGLTIDVVGDGNDVLESINRLSYDLILMDCLLIEMDGYVTTQEIHRRESSQPDHKRLTVIALTTNAMDGDRERCLAHGMDDYLSKSIRAIDLQTMLMKRLTTPSINWITLI